jgi:hypothetical protein
MLFYNEQIKLLDEQKKIELFLLSYAMMPLEVRTKLRDGIKAIDEGGKYNARCLDFSSDDEDENLIGKYSSNFVTDVLNQMNDGMNQEEHNEDDDRSFDDANKEENMSIIIDEIQHNAAVASSLLHQSDSERRGGGHIYVSIAEDEDGQDVSQQQEDNEDELYDEDYNINNEECCIARNRYSHITSGVVKNNEAAQNMQSLDVVSKKKQKEKEWNEMSIPDLIKECQSHSIQADKRFSRKTLVQKLLSNIHSQGKKSDPFIICHLSKTLPPTIIRLIDVFSPNNISSIIIVFSLLTHESCVLYLSSLFLFYLIVSSDMVLLLY